MESLTKLWSNMDYLRRPAGAQAQPAATGLNGYTYSTTMAGMLKRATH